MFQIHTYHLVENFSKEFSLAICHKIAAKLKSLALFDFHIVGWPFGNSSCIAEIVLLYLSREDEPIF